MKTLMSLLRRLFLGGKDVEHHGNCFECGDTLRTYGKSLTPRQRKAFFEAARAAVRQHCT